MANAFSSHDEHFMEHALHLARKAVGLAHPNPPVGCVIVKDGAILGEGFHQYDWKDHAEIVALKQAGEHARGATVYVTLEPCNHQGRTGPCAEALIAAGVSRVVAAMEDPNPKTRGAGFERLRSAGIEVASGLGEEAARELNAPFSWWIAHRTPLVTLKSALTLDGQLALTPAKDKKKGHEWITGEESRAEVQRMRHASDALLTGIGTILADNPMLTDRSGLPRRRPLLRVVLDSKLRLSSKSRIVQTSDNDLLVFTNASLRSPKARQLQNLGVELVETKKSRGGIDLNAVLKELGRRDVLSLLLEAGPRLNAAALSSGLVQRMTLFYAPKIAGSAKVPFLAPGASSPRPIRIRNIRQFGADIAIDALL